MGRPLKVDFASDNKNGNNLKKDDVLFRDSAEVIKVSGNSNNSQQQNSSLAVEVLDSQNATVDEMLDNMSNEQEELLLGCLKEVSKYVAEKEGEQAHRALVEKLAADEHMLKRLTELLDKYRSRTGGAPLGHRGGGGGHIGASGHIGVGDGASNYPHRY